MAYKLCVVQFKVPGAKNGGSDKGPDPSKATHLLRHAAHTVALSDNVQREADLATRCIKMRVLPTEQPCAMCDTCGHAMLPGTACKYCTRTRRSPPCRNDSCDYCARETLQSCARAVCRWDSKNGSTTPRDVWRTSWTIVHLKCDGCGRAYTQPAARIERHDCALCVNKSERLLYDFLRAETCDHVAYQAKIDDADVRRYDFLVGPHVLVELDGPQHFRPVKTWKTGFDVAHADKDKEDRAVSAGYSVVRVLQTDVWENANEWRTYVRDALRTATLRPQVIIPARREYEHGIYARLRAGSFF